MTIGGFLILLLIAAICGAIAQGLVGYSTGGCLISAVVGIIGALLGYWIARQLNLPLLLTINVQGQPFPVVWSIIGSSIFVAILALITGRTHRT
jgi:uncharacterized membrane protein YeaQ/YmgE (transglycosylase-associated protein family)